MINAPHFTRFMVEQMTARGGTLLENCTAAELLATDDGDVTGLIIDNQAGPHAPDRAYSVLPQLAGTIDIDDCRLGIGVRPYPTDGKTIIGPMPDAKGLHIIATHSGITLAPVLGRLMAGAITNGTYPATLAPFALIRFGGFA